MLTRRELITYTFVSQSLFGAKDLLTALLPLIQPIVAPLSGKIFDAERLMLAIRERLPWAINTDVVELLAPRMERLGWVELIVNHDGKRAYRHLEIPQVPYGQNDETEISERLAELGRVFKNFINEISPLEGVPYSAEQLVELLLRWLVESKVLDKDTLLDAVTAPNTLQSTTVIEKDMPVRDIQQFRRQDDYLCARFVNYLSNNNDSLFQQVISLSALATLSEVILSYIDPPKKEERSDTIFYYDGPFVMDLLGISGNARRKNAEYIHNILAELGATSRVLDHSCDEIRDNLNALFSKSPPTRYGPTWSAIQKSEITEQMARDVLDDVEVYVENLGIPIVDTKSAMFPNEVEYFSNDLYETLISEIPWESRRAAERDAKSVTFVMRKRRGFNRPNMFQNKVVLVTRNEILAGKSRRFCIQANLLRTNDFPPVAHQRTVSGILFLALGAPEKHEIARRDLMAICEDVTRARPDLIEGMRKQLAQIDEQKAEGFDALIQRPRSTQLLLDLTLGANELITDNASEIYEKIRLSAAEDVQKKMDARINSLQKKSKIDSEKLKKQLSDMESKVDRLGIRLNEEKSKKLDMVENWMKQTNNRVNKKKRLLIIFILALCVVSFSLGALDYFIAKNINYSLLIYVSAGFVPLLLMLMQISGHYPEAIDRYFERKKNKFLRLYFIDAGYESEFQNYEFDWDYLQANIKAEGRHNERGD